MTELQREALAALTELWQLAPDIRLGQLMTHLGLLAEDQLGRTLAGLDDDELLSVVYRHRAELQARLASSTPPLPVNVNPALPSHSIERR